MEYTKRVFLFLTTLPGVLCLLQACKKDVKQLPGAGYYAQAAFVNASPQLLSDIAYSGNLYVLKDSSDTAFYPGIALAPDLLYFNRDHKLLSPSTAFNAQLKEPWIQYLSMAEGMHRFTLFDTSGYMRAADVVKMNADTPLSVYYTDSMGYFRSLILADLPGDKTAGQCKLRFLDLSPDAGNVFFTIDEQPSASIGYASSLSYGASTPFVSYPNPVADTLRVNFYAVGDTTNVLARTFMQAAPGQSYTLTLEGYYNYSVNYQDPKSGGYKSLSGGLSVIINVNN